MPVVKERRLLCHRVCPEEGADHGRKGNHCRRAMARKAEKQGGTQGEEDAKGVKSRQVWSPAIGL